MHKYINTCIDKIRLWLRKDKEPFLKLYEILGFYPHNLDIYKVALMHRSLGGRNDRQQSRHVNNERLEFLGDALLSAVVADVLYQRYKGQQEGFLTTLRSKIVKRETLNELAVKIGLDKLVQHSGNMGTAHNSYMNGNAFEAFFAAIYIDRGYYYCMQFMTEQIFSKYIDIEKMSAKEENYKSKLIEWCQHYQCKFEFVVTNEKIEDGNAPKFYSEVLIEGVSCGKGVGYSKKESHQQAAQVAYKKVKSNVRFVNHLIETRNNRVKGIPTQTKPNTEPQAPKTTEPTKPAKAPAVAKPSDESEVVVSAPATEPKKTAPRRRKPAQKKDDAPASEEKKATKPRKKTARDEQS